MWPILSRRGSVEGRSEITIRAMRPDDNESLEAKAGIVRNALDLARAFVLERHRVAILAAVETVNPKMAAMLDAAALCKMADRGQIAGAIVDRPLALDNAVSAAAARTKGIVSEVPSCADFLVVPDLENGNMLAKQLEYLGGAASAGLVVGAGVPIVLTSRADSRKSSIASCTVAVFAARRVARPAVVSAPGSQHSPYAPTAGVGLPQPGTRQRTAPLQAKALECEANHE